jgi:ABC-type transporter Mla MlaB component
MVRVGKVGTVLAVVVLPVAPNGVAGKQFDSPDKSTPGAIRGRKARGLAPCETAQLPKVSLPRERTRTGSGVGGDDMSATQATARSMLAPAELGLDTRLAFREAAIRLLDELPDGATLAVDLTPTERVDSAGLSALMLVQRHAADRGQQIVLRHPSDELRFLLALTQMTDLFTVEPRRP